ACLHPPPPPPTSPLFPYTTLFRSQKRVRGDLHREHLRKPRRMRVEEGDKRMLDRAEFVRGACRVPRADQHARGPHDRHDQANTRSEEHTSELQSLRHLVCRLLLEK